MSYLVFDIGCIECGEESGVVGVYATIPEATAFMASAKKAQQDDWNGQHDFGIYDLAIRGNYKAKASMLSAACRASSPSDDESGGDGPPLGRSIRLWPVTRNPFEDAVFRVEEGEG